MNEVLDILENTGAVTRNSHFVGTSGRHMSIYMSKDSLLAHPKDTFRITQLLAEKVKDFDIDIVAAPTVGGVIFGQEVAYHLSLIKNKDILSVYAEKTPEGPLIFKRGYDLLVKDKNVLIIDDTIATGLSVNKMIDVVKNFGGNIVAMAVILNRVPDQINSNTLGIPFFHLCEILAETFDPKDCNLCKNNVPINTKVGHGKDFLASLNK